MGTITISSTVKSARCIYYTEPTNKLPSGVHCDGVKQSHEIAARFAPRNDLGSACPRKGGLSSCVSTEAFPLGGNDAMAFYEAVIMDNFPVGLST